MEFLKTYTVLLSPNLSDISGQFLGDHSWSFTTRDAEWGKAKIINEVGAVNYQLAMDKKGNILVVWDQYIDGADMVTQILAVCFDKKSNTWGEVELLGTTDFIKGRPKIAIDNAGNGFAVWKKLNGAVVDIWVNYYDATVGIWGDAELLPEPV